MAIRWMTALVEPPSASTTLIAFSKDSSESGDGGRETMRRPDATAIRGWSLSAAGMDAAPGNDTPSASTAEVIVEAVPIVMQWPGDEAIRSSAEAQSASRDRSRPAARPSTSTRPNPSPSVWPRQERPQHRPGRDEDERQPRRDRAHDQRGRRLVAPAQQHGAVERIGPQQLLGLHRQQVAIEHRRRLHGTARSTRSPGPPAGTRPPARRRASRPRPDRAGGCGTG